MRRAALGLALAACLSGCRAKTDVTRIHALLAKGEAAAEDSDVRGVTDLVADDFKADELDRQTLKGYLAARLLRGERITVIRRDETITVDGSTATAGFDAALLAGERAKLKGTVPNRMGTYHFDLTLSKRDDVWKVTSAKYREIPAAKFAIEAADF